MFQDLLSILPGNVPSDFKFLGPYLKTATNPPRHAIAHSATNTDSFFAALNNYVLRVCKAGQHYELLLSFWAGITTDAVAGRLGLVQLGRKEIQRQRQEDVLLKVLPVLNDGLQIHDVPELTLACYTLAIILASKGNLADNVIDSLMDLICESIPAGNSRDSLVCLYILCRHRSQWEVPQKSLLKVMHIPKVDLLLSQIAEQYEIENFVLALYRASLHGMKKGDFAERIQFAERLICAQAWAEATLVGALVTSIQRIGKLSSDDSIHVSAKARLLDMLRRLCEAEEFEQAMVKAASLPSVDAAKLESDLQLLITAPEREGSKDDIDMDLGSIDGESPMDVSTELLSRLPQRTVDEHSFLTHSTSHVFGPLKDAFLVLCRSDDGLQQLRSLPIWQSAPEPADPLLISFLLRMAFGSYPLSARLCAIKMVTVNLRSRQSELDVQALLPYVSVMLADSADRVRKEAANLLVAFEEAMPKDLVQGEEVQRWGASDLYTTGGQSTGLSWIEPQDVIKIVRRVYLPALEECVLDSTQIARTLQNALLGSSSSIRTSAKTDATDLKKSLRYGLFDLLLSHLMKTPLYNVRFGLLEILESVDKVGSMSRTKQLLPMLEQWASLSTADAQAAAQAAHSELPILEARMAAVISPNEKDFMQVILRLATEGLPVPRPTYVRASFARIIQIWPALSLERQTAAAHCLFERTLNATDNPELGRYAKEALLSVVLPTEAVIAMLDEVHSSFARVREHSPSAKRRRTSQNQMLAIASTDMESIKSNLATATFLLELVDGSKPESRPQLLGPLFHLLAALQYLKGQTRSEFSYLLSLNLGILLAIVSKAGTSSKPHLDESAIRTELIIDCVRMTESPQVQNVALLLIAALCKIVPGRVLHNIMPIFTFMSTGVMRKDDEHSVHVIDQTIELVIPALIKSLRSQRRDVILGTSELLASFVAAFDHIPSHRRLRLFGNLVSKLGADDFLFAIVAMLSSREGDSATIHASLAMLMNAFSISTQLITVEKYVDVIRDALQRKPGQAQVLLGLDNNQPEATRQKVLALVQTLSDLFKRPVFRASLREELDPMQLRKHLSTLLEQMLNLAKEASADEIMAPAVKECLTSLLGLPSFVEYINVARECLDRDDNELRRKVLQLLELRLQKVGTKNKSTQAAAIAFLAPLRNLLVGEDDLNLKHAALACIDRISDEFGRGDIPAIIVTSRIVASDDCLGEKQEKRMKVMALLCLASMVEVLQEATVPAIPNIMPRAFRLLEQSMEEGNESSEQHDAAFSLLSAILSHVPYMISESYLDRLLVLCAESANAELGPDCDESRREMLQLLAKQLELRVSVTGLHGNWSTAVENNILAVKENLETLSGAIDRHSKSSVVKNADLLSDFLLQAFDFRRVQLTIRTEDSFTDAEVAEVESEINILAIKLIYKLNDTILRPIFSRLVNWAINCPGINKNSLTRAQTLRQTTLFNFSAYFFGTLKSIVTSYTSYLLESAVEVLKKTALHPSADNSETTSTTGVDIVNLWLSVLSMLRESTTHDADAFFASPSHFDMLAPILVSQLNLSSSNTFTAHVDSTVITTIVALATAVLDNPTHLKTLNHHICLLRHSESTAVRMAGIKCQVALTESEELGTDWLENCIRAGEGLVYANEMLEDDDEDIEREVRRWVFKVNELLGEDILEA